MPLLDTESIQLALRRGTVSFVFYMFTYCMLRVSRYDEFEENDFHLVGKKWKFGTANFE